MWWLRRRRTPLWVWILAFLGLKSLWSWQTTDKNPKWQEKRHRFRTKLDEAFAVWREDEEADGAPGDTESE